MKEIIADISVLNLSFIFIPVAIVIIIFTIWKLSYRSMIYATLRMLFQLILIGYGLLYLFELKNPYSMTLILLIMLFIAAWISMRPIRKIKEARLFDFFISLIVGSIPTLLIVLFAVLQISDWYEPRYLLPIAGMIFANAMNTTSLAAERFHAETGKDVAFMDARNSAIEASLLPLMNSFFAVGLVSLPGMMTGQILAGVSPLIAVRYQIMVMCMLLGASGISAVVYLLMQKQSISQPK